MEFNFLATVEVKRLLIAVIVGGHAEGRWFTGKGQLADNGYAGSDGFDEIADFNGIVLERELAFEVA